MNEAPTIVVLGGPNGAGKSPFAAILLPDSVAFINADEIVKTLANAPSPAADVEAGRILLRFIDDRAAQNADFAIEITLSSRALAPRIKRLQAAGYAFHLLFIWAPDVELSVLRVAERVRRGGHNIPEDVIRRRYRAGVKNFFELYPPIADKWEVYTNNAFGYPNLISAGQKNDIIVTSNPEIWSEMKRMA